MVTMRHGHCGSVTNDAFHDLECATLSTGTRFLIIYGQESFSRSLGLKVRNQAFQHESTHVLPVPRCDSGASQQVSSRNIGLSERQETANRRSTSVQRQSNHISGICMD